MVNGTLENDVAKMSGTNLHSLLAGETAAVLVHDTHSRVVDGVEVWLECLLIIYQSACDLCYRHRTDKFWGHDAEL